jgi:hypothetical protein
MPEIGTSGSMSGDGKAESCQKAKATAPILDFTGPGVRCSAAMNPLSGSDENLVFGRCGQHR